MCGRRHGYRTPLSWQADACMCGQTDGQTGQTDARTHGRTDTRTDARTRRRTNLRTHRRTDACMDKQTDEQTDARTHARTSMHTHTHTHTFMVPLMAVAKPCLAGCGRLAPEQLALTIINLVGTALSSFTFDAPTLTSLGGLQNYATTGGTLLTLGGLNLARADTSPTVTLGLTEPCATSSWLSQTSLACGVAAPTSLAQLDSTLTKLRLHGANDGATLMISFDAPLVSHGDGTTTPSYASLALSVWHKVYD